MDTRSQFDPRAALDFSPEKKLEFLVLAASLAPSSHNSQPWRFSIQQNSIQVLRESARNLPVSDARGRQLFLSLGCAIENILLAADYLGLKPEVEFLPAGDASPLVARINFSSATPRRENSHLIFSIAKRHTNRSPYEARPVPEEFLLAARKFGNANLEVTFVSDEARRTTLTYLVGKATEAAFADRAFCRELSQWMKPSLAKYRLGMPGYNIGVPWALSFILPFAIRSFDLKKQQRKMVETMLRQTPVFGVLSTKEDIPLFWLEAGKVYERIALIAEAEGLRTGVLAAAIEIGDFYREVRSVIGTSFRPQVFFRLGYAKKIPRFSPRLDIREILET